MNPKVTIIVVLYNSRQWLPRLCASLKKQTVWNQLEVLFVDSASTDDSVAQVKTLLPKARVLGSGQNSFTHANNLGVREAVGTYIMLVNPDMWLEPSCVEMLLQEIERLPNAGALVPRVLSYEQGQNGEYLIDTTGLELLPTGRVIDRGQGEYDRGQYQNIERVFGLSGACGLLRREALAEVSWNGEILDNKFCLYQEDVDLSFRLQRTHWEILYIPQAIAHHNRTVKQTDHESARKRRSQRSALVNAYSYRNHLSVLMTHLTWPFVKKHAIRLVSYEIGKAGFVLFMEPKTAIFVMKSSQNFIDAWRKRKHFAKLQTSEPTAILDWIKHV